MWADGAQCTVAIVGIESREISAVDVLKVLKWAAEPKEVHVVYHAARKGEEMWSICPLGGKAKM